MTVVHLLNVGKQAVFYNIGQLRVQNDTDFRSGLPPPTKCTLLHCRFVRQSGEEFGSVAHSGFAECCSEAHPRGPHGSNRRERACSATTDVRVRSEMTSPASLLRLAGRTHLNVSMAPELLLELIRQ